jgi:hypothetical protein
MIIFYKLYYIMPAKKQLKVVKCIRKKIEDVMHEYKKHSLKRRDGKNVKSRKEAIAIALNMSRDNCNNKKSKSSKRKSSKRKSSKK